jgi:transcriptional regulator NrdR family protein
MIECPICKHKKSRVEVTREKGEHYERFRICMNCGAGFTTREYSTHNQKRLLSEVLDETLNNAVKKFGGR